MKLDLEKEKISERSWCRERYVCLIIIEYFSPFLFDLHALVFFCLDLAYNQHCLQIVYLSHGATILTVVTNCGSQQTPLLLSPE